MTPFDFVNAINYKKIDLMKDDEQAEKDYVPFIVNRTLSYFPDTVMYANEINQRIHLDNKLQFHYFLNSIRTSKRFSKWVKKEGSADLEVVKQYYGYSDEKAEQALSLLSTDQLQIIKKRLDKGGT